ncbi:efflux RND transporter periplasmic adaptor subunit [Desulfoprunum benzoelyticum]|uniref:HlyD family secretion protein n=1 Tax=Desulfoprunum benzoelyticum TaxID=1506996 RepID=A0A840UUY9_9BACT|nr:efflux RND transporter periplasmic adaptor subunit [Desulfoprunum benzoelyticum]MBB5349602.1 HlyD family secretion protein [Desulfoprunum benzoelyticum]MBM9531504.1 efflux RND transporter periplasmic adaptor subunit [Desulfoprunum benzoelyticum]
MNDTTPPSTNQAQTLQQLIGATSARRPYRWVWLGAALIVGLGAAWFYFRGGDEALALRYTTAAAEVGTLVVKVSATGNLQPTNTVDVGSELSGIVAQVLVDDNDAVKEGQVLAQLDLSQLQDAVAKSRAALAAAEAQVLQAQATVAEATAVLSRYRQVAQLSGGKVPSRSEMDTADADLKRAQANEASAHASVTEARANLQSNETNLAKASIRSPIDGVVLSRQVDPGQTVAASFQAPVLFQLAEDLTKMELQVDVDEADVGQVQAGQKAVFGVDAWPGREYTAVITRVGFGSQEADGVVSYLTVLEVGNDDLSLRPGMTGTAEITTLTRENALLVPNAALRFSPPVTTVGDKKKSSGSVMRALMPRPSRQTPKVQAKANSGAPRVWVLRDNRPVAVDVKTGATNGRLTEITAGDLAAGMQVITEALSVQR